jgi:methylaspartate ammonia-lyase
MIRIVQVVAVPALGGYYAEDLAALQAHPIPLPDRYTAAPITPGFRAVRQPAEAVSVGLVLDGLPTGRQIVWGDCTGVAYGGKGGRDPVFYAADGLAVIEQVAGPALMGRELTHFRELAAELDVQIASAHISLPGDAPQTDNGSGRLSRREALSPLNLLRAVREEISRPPEVLTPPLLVRRRHSAVRYGISQALLAAVALARRLTMAEVIAEEWGLPPPDAPVPIHAQSGRERYHNADKMIVRRIASLPHALVDDIPDQLGRDGGKLVQYVRWLKERIARLAGEDYRPILHLDVHGGLGRISGDEPGRVLGHLYALEQAAKPYPLRIECPVMMDSRAAQIERMKTLRGYIRARRMTVQLVADEWADTLEDIRAFIEAGAADMIQIKMPDLGGLSNAVEAVLACHAGGVGALLGGSCAETDLSARASVHVALATRPEAILAKPGMGVDEGIMLVHNEMARTLAWIKARGVGA